MKGLLRKDLYMARKYCRAYFLLVGTFWAVSLFSDGNMFFIAYPVLIGSMLPVTLLAYEERDKWTQYACALPLTRAQIVTEKYGLALLCGGSLLLLTAGTQLVRMTVQETVSWRGFFTLCTMLLVMGLIGPALVLPFVFRLGVEKGRLAYFIGIGVLCGAAAVLMQPQENVLQRAPQTVGWLALAAVAALALFALSWRLSVRFYRRREL